MDGKGCDKVDTKPGPFVMEAGFVTMHRTLMLLQQCMITGVYIDALVGAYILYITAFDWERNSTAQMEICSRVG